MPPTWTPRQPEIRIAYNKAEAQLYREADPTGRYHDERWPLLRGRGRHGEFPLVVARSYFRQRGYTVWASEPELPDDTGFILVSYPGKRRRHHPAYVRMQNVFGEARLHDLNAATDDIKRARTGGRGGGDPDLFVFRGNMQFFVEVKWWDQITMKQAATFPLIEKLCDVEVRVARLTPAAG